MLRLLLLPVLLWSALTAAVAQQSNTSAVIDLSNVLGIDQLLTRIESRRVIYVSETHTRYDHHLNQLAVIDHQHQQHDNLAIGLEFIQRPFQPVLDNYVAGRIDEEAMLRGTEYFDRWSYDYRLYRPIFNYAREHGIRLLALNIDRDLTNQIRERGLDSLSDEQRARLPADIDRDNEAYRQRILEAFQHHPKSEEKNFEGFIEIQLLWDETMAETAANWLAANPDGYLVVLAGSGHILYGDGIPDRVSRRIDLPSASVINLDEEAGVNRDMGDYIILSEQRELSTSGKMGVILDNSDSPPRIVGFSDDSEADDVGLKKDDQIIRIGERQITDYFDIRMALLDMNVGEEVEVEVSRSGFFSGDKTHAARVKLK